MDGGGVGLEVERIKWGVGKPLMVETEAVGYACLDFCANIWVVAHHGFCNQL